MMSYEGEVVYITIGVLAARAKTIGKSDKWPIPHRARASKAGGKETFGMLRRLRGYPGRYYDGGAFLLTGGRNALILIRMAGLAVTAAAAIGLKFKFPAAAVA